VIGVIAAITRFEPVHVNVPNGNYRRIVSETLRTRGVPMRRIRFHEIRTNECWTRDHGPAFVLRTRRGRTEAAIVDWGFNAWGGKYPAYDDDDAVPMKVARELELPVFAPGIVMEGGAVDFNGAGSILTTTSCLLNKNRNPHLSKAEIERYLCDYYGQQQVLWLGEGIEGDDTDGHIDDIARFVSPGRVVCAREPDPRSPNHEPLEDCRARLLAARDAAGRALEVIDLPMPAAVLADGAPLPASYANFYVANGAVLVPTFGCPADEVACSTLRDCFPGRRVVPVDCRVLIAGLGALHCMTQQVPAVPAATS